MSYIPCDSWFYLISCNPTQCTSETDPWAHLVEKGFLSNASMCDVRSYHSQASCYSKPCEKCLSTRGCVLSFYRSILPLTARLKSMLNIFLFLHTFLKITCYILIVFPFPPIPPISSPPPYPSNFTLFFSLSKQARDKKRKERNTKTKSKTNRISIRRKKPK